ncbi:MAG: bifunctional methylenetetrahydrofolate dehydrogenase/methenyltetrahydrofolate cyclohydrolase FolD [Clostridia bacterium]|nr:bifunctional methylenetetrahydrofolate dehydrogenase/methenyltetrahydrofolate cyclohydrolase FolD [Clostridia bacterium]
MAKIIDGKMTSTAVREKIKRDVSKFTEETGKTPGLAVVIVGENPASQVYVRNKHKACGEVGIYSEVHELPESINEDELLALIDKLNSDKKINGILVQLPLPKHLDEEKVLLRIDPNKDVDAFHPVNVGKIMIGNFSFLPCTPAGVMELLKHYEINTSGRHCVIIGRSNIVGKPQAMLMLKENATVTICHSKTENLADITKQADILVAAVGRANFVKADMVKEGATVIDVGINRNAEGKLCGDVDFNEVEPIASYITPVPGGVGPMTITMLLKNTLTAAKEQYK